MYKFSFFIFRLFDLNARAVEILRKNIRPETKRLIAMRCLYHMRNVGAFVAYIFCFLVAFGHTNSVHNSCIDLITTDRL